MSGYGSARRAHPLLLTTVVAAHALALGALMMARMEAGPVHPEPPIKIIDLLPAKPPPDPIKPPPRDDQVAPPQAPTDFTSPPPRIPMPGPGPSAEPLDVLTPPRALPPGDEFVLGPPTAPPVPEPLPPAPVPVPDPVRTQAELDNRYADAFQPPYPDSLLRNGKAGAAVVRVLIGTNGRVKAVEPVRADDPAFLRATERQARGRWRFKPATLDGKPIESWKRITVSFELRDG